MKKQWNYVEKDGNPKMAGMYWVTLIYPERKDGKKTGKFMAEVDTRYFADLDKEPDLKGLTMDGEPDNGFAWTEEFQEKEYMPGCLWKMLKLLICRRELRAEILSQWRYRRDKSRDNQVPWTATYKYPV